MKLSDSISDGCASPTRFKSWKSIDWISAQKQVRSLQLRIAKATREGKKGKVKALQWILTHSMAAKVLAVKRVTQNKGAKTPGVDLVRWTSPAQKLGAAKSLVRKGYKAQPLRRLYILKKNGKLRPLGIPTMKDRAMQALYLFALEPVSETLADRGSYGFRKFRSCHDALERCYIHLSRTDSASWVLEGDIKGCFENISHKWLMDNTLIDKKILQHWLKAGFRENKRLFPTDMGTPQGGIISPTLANIALDGLEKELDTAFGIVFRPDGCRKNNIHKIHLIRYADDFIVTASSKEILEEKVKPLIERFLLERGLQLSQEKTRITHITDGFDFLGQNIRLYAKGKLLTRPSKESIRSVKEKLKEIIVRHRGSNAARMIYHLNPVITGWANYHRHACSKKAFYLLDRILFRNIWNWARRTHNNLGYRKIVSLYFATLGKRRWVFSGKFANGRPVYLRSFGHVKIKRHRLIRGEAHPFDPKWFAYLEKRNGKKNASLF
jgi:RNA-directed DNA polymerase